MTVVLDSSALLAYLLGETGGEMVRARLEGAHMSTVNLSEVVARLIRDHPAAEIPALMEDLPIRMRKPDEGLAIEAGLMAQPTAAAGLSLGDRFCLALARRIGAPALTADRMWSTVAQDVGVEVVQIRQ